MLCRVVTQEKHFEQRWVAARDTEAIRNLILLSTRRRDTNPERPYS